MARLHEYEGKALLRNSGLRTPRGVVAATPDEAMRAARDLGGQVVVKIQAWVTGRKAIGGVAIAQAPDEAGEHASRMLTMRIGNFPVEAVLVEECLDIRRELFVSVYLDDRARAPAMLLSQAGGSGVEERTGQVATIACDVQDGPDMGGVRAWIEEADIDGDARAGIEDAVIRIFQAAKANEARTLEVNPLAILNDGSIACADCRVTIDDYAVFRHPDLGIEIARELDHPPTHLERIAYAVEQADHRGTFYFVQLNWAPEGGKGDGPGLIGFHGAGGGGSMMSMDAITGEGFTIANFCDTSGNPSAAKVYRAARIILSQPGLVGYFGSGSGVASQEQYWSAYALAKAFWELNLDIPAVVRLGGNSEERAIAILEGACSDLPGIVEAYGKDDSPRDIARRMGELVRAMRDAGAKPWTPRCARIPEFVGALSSWRIPVADGAVWVDLPACDGEATRLIAAHSGGVFREENGELALTSGDSDLVGKESELIACEVECRMAGKPVIFAQLDVPGLEES